MNSCKYCGEYKNDMYKMSNEKDNVIWFICSSCFIGTKYCYMCNSTKFYNQLKCLDCNVKSSDNINVLKNTFNQLVLYLKDHDMIEDPDLFLLS